MGRELVRKMGRTICSFILPVFIEHVLCAGNCFSVSCSVVSASLQPHGCSSLDFSVHGIHQARILEWVAISFFRGSSPPRDQTCVSCRFLAVRADFKKWAELFVHVLD